MADSNEPDLLVWKDWCVDQLGPAKMVADIDRADIEELIARRRNHGRVKAGRDEKGKQLYRPITLTTINRTVPRLMRRILNYARCSLRQQVQFIPWSEVIKKPPKRPIRELSLSEEEKLETVERPEVMAVRRFKLASGFRITPIINLTWPQVDFANETVTVIEKGKKPLIKPMDSQMREILWELWSRPHHETHVFSFVSQRTRIEARTGRQLIKGRRYPITYAGIRSASDRDWGKVGVKIRRHDMRHTAGMRMMRETGDIKATSEFLGHSGVAITEHFYLDADTTRQRQAMERRNEGVRRRREELERIGALHQQPASSGAAVEPQSPHIAPHTTTQRRRKPL